MRNIWIAAALCLIPAFEAKAVGLSDVYDSGLHDYVLGRHAWSNEELRRASDYFAGALQYSPNDPVLLRRTFDLALSAGNEPLAVRLAERLTTNERFDTTIVLLRATEALKRRDWAAADAARLDLTDAGYAAFIGPVLQAWTLYGRGKRSEALTMLDPQAYQGFARNYVLEHRAHLLAAEKHYAEAATIYDTLLNSGGGQVTRLRLAAANNLQSAKQIDQAQRLLEAGGRDPVFIRALARLAAGQPIGGGVTDPQAGVAQLFVRIAADLSRERPLPIALNIGRLATFLAPKNGDGWLAVADVLIRSEQYDAALTALDSIRADDVVASYAQARRALLLQETDREAEALALLQKAAMASDATVDDWVRLGEVHQRAEHYKEAAAAFDRALALVPDLKPEQWYLPFARGTARERAGDWAGAEADLRRALSLAPNEPSVLNYLGYALLDRGQSMAEAQSLIERAVELRSDDGYIIDSLGWVHYRAGRYEKAVELLERAISQVPGDPTINDHLGDAYWHVGRRVEARYRWRAALDAGPTEADRARIAAKLDFGLDVATALHRT